MPIDTSFIGRVEIAILRTMMKEYLETFQMQNIYVVLFHILIVVYLVYTLEGKVLLGL